MADRSVKVVVRADVQPLKSAMADGGKSIDGLAGKASGLGGKIKSGLSYAAAAGGVLSLGAAIKSTFSLGLDFTTQMNTLQAVTGASGDVMAKVSDKARDLGNDITIPGTSARDAAEAMTELAKGGLSVQDAMDAAKGTLQLAAAAQVSGAEAAQIQANALNTFGLKASDAGHVADVLANTANAASGEITDFAQGMQQAGSVAKLFGISLDDTSTVLGLFANNGIKGSDAGTSFKTMLTQLATPSAKAKQAMDALNLTVYDANGQFVGMRSLSDQLAKAQGRMSQAAFQSAAGIVFGSDAIRGASILASGGVTAFDNMRSAVEKTGGAADLAGAKMKGLPGALQNMQNAAENVALGLYEKLAPAVESVINGLSDTVNTVGPIVVGTLGTVIKVIGGVAGAFNSLPGPIKTFALALGAIAIANKIGLLDRLTGALGTVRGAFGGLRGAMGRVADDAALAGVSKMRAGLGLVADSAKRVGSSLASAFGPQAIAAAGIAVLSGMFDEVQHEMHLTDDIMADHESAVRSLAEAYKQTGGAVNDMVREQAWADIQTNSKAVINWAKEQGIGLDKLVDAYLGLPSGDAVRAKLSAWGEAQDAMGGSKTTRTISGIAEWTGLQGGLAAKIQDTTDAAERNGAAVKAFLGTQGEAVQSNKDEAEAVGGVTDATTSATLAHVAAARALNNYTTAAGSGADATKDQGDALVDMAPAQQRYLDQLQRQYVEGEKARIATEDLGASAHITAFKVHETADAMRAANEKAHDLTQGASDLEYELAKLSGRTPKVEEATRRFNGALQQAIESAKDAKGNVTQLGAGVVKASGQIDTGTKAGQDLYDSVTSMASAAQDAALAQASLAGATGGTTAAADAASKSLAHSRDEFIKNHDAMGLTEEQARKLADAYFGIPKDIKTLVTGEPNFHDVDAKLQALAEQTTYVNIGGKWIGSDAPGGILAGPQRFRASGGPVNPFTDYVVGEKGPEILRMGGSGGWVFSNEQSKRMAAASPSIALPGRASGGSVGPAHRSQQTIVREVHYHITGVPGESIDSLVQKVERRIMFHSPVMAG